MAEPFSKQADRQRADHHKAGAQPISRHPLFPAIVALWFAALLGMGSFALSASLLEKLVIAGHVDSLIPAAAPPLGASARLMLALVLGLAAGLVGWIVSKRLAAPQRDAGPQVFSVTEAGLDTQPQWPGMAEVPNHFEAPRPAGPAPSLDPSSLAPVSPAPCNFDQGAEQSPRRAAPVKQEAIAAPAHRAAAQRILAADLADLSHVELVERLALALQRREELLGTASGDAAGIANPVLHFPDLANRRNARLALPVPQSGPVPQETEKALRAALAQLKQLSGTA